MECVIDVVRNVTAEYKLTTLWASHTNAFQMHLANIKRCYTTDARDDEEVVEECLGVAAYREFMDLMKEVRTSEYDESESKIRFNRLTILFSFGRQTKKQRKK